MADQLALFADSGDGPARDAIRTRLDATLFVEAGAGTGKTAALVDRVVALVRAGVPVRAIAAITFTEKAAAELRDRVRRELEADGATEALEELDAAAICTLHSFAQRILTEFPIEAGLPPRIIVRDEISSRVAFEARWRLFVDELLEDPGLEQAILVMLASGVRLEHLRTVAEVLDDSWDLLDRIDPPPSLPDLGIDAWLTDLDAVCATVTQCRVEGDTMVARLGELAEYHDRLRHALDDVERVRLLGAGKPSFRAGHCGRTPSWTDLKAVRERIARLDVQRKALVNHLVDAAIRRVVAALARYTADAVAERRGAGELEFHDLLVLARTLLRDAQHGARARRRLRDRYQRLLIDEFQDTDPIQVEIAALLGSADPDDGAREWNEMTVEPGRLFFVGDPKQSIYRFRRADIATFLAAADRFAERATPEYLTCNFRSTPRVLAWINRVFGELIQPFPGSQPEYRALEAERRDPIDASGPGVMLLGVTPHADDPNADTLRVREAADVAAVVRQVLAERWPVYEPGQGEWRDPRLGDICILLPARTSLGFLERSLDDAGIPYRAETSSLVYGSREIRELLAALRAVDDPSDSLSLVTALRSSLFGCGDDDLFTYHVEHRGQWDVRLAPAETLSDDHPVAAAMTFLRDVHEQRIWSAPSELLERIVRERRVIEVAALGGRFRDVARRVRFVVDQARAFTDAAGGTLRDYLAWADLQGTEGARVVEAVLPETDDDAVRILTIHGAKGLEFPIVIASGTTTAAQVPRRGVQVLFPPAGGYEVRINNRVQTAHFELHQPVDEQMDFHEKLRLLYVACTRARDHLVVSTHRKTRDLDPLQRPRWTLAELLWDAAAARPGTLMTRARPKRCRRALGCVRRHPSRSTSGTRCTSARFNRATGARSSPPPRSRSSLTRPPRQATPASRRKAVTWSCHRGTRVATARPSDARCMPCSRPSTCQPATASPRPRPRKRQPKVCSAGRRRSPRWRAPRSRARSCGARPKGLTGERRTSPCRSTGSHSRGTSIWCTATTTVSSSWTTRRTRCKAPTSTNALRTTACKLPRTRSRSPRPPASPSCAACSACSTPTVRATSSSRATSWWPASPRSGSWRAPSATTPRRCPRPR